MVYSPFPGPVTYRVVQVTQNEDGQILAAGIPSGVTQVVTNPFAQEDSPSAENIGDARFTYIPQATAETSTQAVTDNVNAVAAANLGQVATTGGEQGGKTLLIEFQPYTGNSVFCHVI